LKRFLTFALEHQFPNNPANRVPKVFLKLQQPRLTVLPVNFLWLAASSKGSFYEILG